MFLPHGIIKPKNNLRVWRAAKSILDKLRHGLGTAWGVEVVFELGEQFEKLHLEVRPLGSENLDALHPDCLFRHHTSLYN